ncbi:MAG: glycerol-3-phosphate 1-O-acyltransferase PlsY [Mariniphaga sp.]
MNLFPEIALLLFAYLLGAIPFGYIFTRKYLGKNIMDHGSGNIGSTNVERIGGKKLGLLTQICDISKGLIPVSIVYIVNIKGIYNFSEYYIYLVALAPILGHDFSIFLNLKGGKGVNTTLGASVLLAPVAVGISVLIYFLVKWKFKTVSIGSIVLALTLLVFELVSHNVGLLFYYLLICTLLIVYKHIPNIKRLLNKSEPKAVA